MKNKFYALILSMSFLAQPALAAGFCHDLFFGKDSKAKQENKLDLRPSVVDRALDAAEQIQIMLSVLTDKSVARISWDYYQKANELLQLSKTLSNSDKEHLKVILADRIQSDAAEKMKKSLNHRTFLDANYNYFRILNDINSNLKFPVFPDFGLKQVKSNEQTVEIAARIISDLTKKYEDDFAQLGHKNLESFRTYSKNYSVHSNWVIENLRDNAQVALHRPEGARFWIPMTGFQNQRTTGGSKGFYDPSFEIRNETESGLLKLNSKAYNLMSVRTMPNYAEMRYDFKEVPHEPSRRANAYGTDLWMIKKEVLDKRATVTPKDSLDMQEESESVVAKSFIPWKFREILTPLLVNPEKLNVMSHGPEYWNQRPKNFTFKSLWTDYSSYVEVQIFGSLTLDDVSAFHFKKNPPDKEFYNLLKSKNIEVYDERQWPPKKWEP